MNTHKLEGIALFMVLLIISMPISSAALIGDVYSISNGGVRDYRAAIDKTTVVAEIAQSGISVSDVRLHTQQNLPFKSCTFTAGKSICTYNFTEGWASGSVPYFVTYQEEQSPVHEITVDSLAPNVSITDLNSGKQLSVSYHVKERAFDEGDSDHCSGIKTVSFVLAGKIIQTLNLSTAPGDCDKDLQATMTAPSTNNVERSFCVQVTDGVGNKGQACKDVLVDKEGATASNLEVFNSQGQKITYVSSKIGPIDGKLTFTVHENNLSSIVADASDFSVYDVQKDAMKNIGVSCVPQSCDGTCSCEVPITLNLPDGGTPALRLIVTDKSENTAPITLSTTILADNVAPKVLSLTGKQCGSTNAIGPLSNTITATIDESGSGLSARKIYLDLNSVLGTEPKFGQVYPNNCILSGTQWKCTWGPFNVDPSKSIVSGTQLPINIVSPSQDDAGNFIETSQTNFIYDNKKPQFISSDIFASSSASFGNEITAYPTSGGTIELTVVASDDLPLTATADFSNIAFVKSKTVSCSGGANQTCTFTLVGPLYGGPLKNATIPVNITDCAGNVQSAVVYTDISVLESSTQNYWDYSVGSPMPERVDRQTLKVFPHQIYFPLIRGGSPSVVPILQQIESCSGDTGFFAYNLQGKRLPDVIGSPSTSQYAKFTVQRNVQPPDSVSLNCIIKTISRTSTGRISLPEFDNVTFTLDFYNSPLGTIDQNLKDKVDRIKNSGLVKGKILSTLNDIVTKAQSVCAAWSSLLSIGAVVTGVGTIIGIFQFTPAGGVSGSIRRVGEAITEGAIPKIGPIMIRFCNLVSCKTLPFSFNDKIAKALDVYKGAKLEKAFGLGKQPTGKSADQGLNVNIDLKDSLVLSTATLCLPGIVYNLQKARAIECSYLYCIDTQVRNGVPPFFCESQRAAAWCKYVWGEVFQVIPFTQFLDDALGLVKTAITEPIFAASAIFTLVCKVNPSDAIASACSNVRDVLQGASAIGHLTSANNWKGILAGFKGGDDICKSVLE